VSSTVKATAGLTNHYVELYQKHYGFKPSVNGYKARFAFDTMLNQLEVSEIKELLDYYFKTSSTNGHDLNWFLYNYESLAVGMEIQRRDQEQQEVIRSQTEQRTKEWRDRIAHRDTGS